MRIYFEDWSEFIFMLDQKGIRHGDKIIKCFATHLPESELKENIGKDSIVTIESDHSPFHANEVFRYERGVYTGLMLEEHLVSVGLSELGKETARALFRFAYEMGFNQSAMNEQEGKGWLIHHPFDDIDGIQKGKDSNGSLVDAELHLDVFFSESLALLEQVIGGTEGYGSRREGTLLRRPGLLDKITKLSRETES